MEKQKVKRDIEVGKIGLLHIFSFSMPYESFISIKKQLHVWFPASLVIFFKDALLNQNSEILVYFIFTHYDSFHHICL